MSRTYVPYIAALGLLWGASYMFIKVAVRGYEPAAMIMFRLIIAAALLLAFFLAQRGAGRAVADFRALGWQGFALGVINGAIPFTLIAWGEKHIDSGVAAIANATVPIFVVLLAGSRARLSGERGWAGSCSGSSASACSQASIRVAAGGAWPGRLRSLWPRFRTRPPGSGASVSSPTKTDLRSRQRRCLAQPLRSCPSAFPSFPHMCRAGRKRVL